MTDQEDPSKTRTSEDPKASLSDLLRVGSDENAMLLGTTPESAEDEAAGEATAAEGEKTGEAKDEAPAAPQAGPTEAGRSPAKRRFSGGQALGVLIAVAGIGLLVAPMLSTSLAQAVEHVVDPLASAGVLIVGGLLLSASSSVRRNLQTVQGSVEDVRRETARLERIAADSRAVLDALQGVRLENTALHADVVKLQAKIKRLTDIVSNPDYAGSIFRLAASVDSLGKHVEVYMKDQFGALQQRLAAVAQQSEHAEHQLKAALGQVHALTKEQLRVQQLAVQEGFGQVQTSSDKSIARIDQTLQVTARIEASIQSQQAALASGWAKISDRLAASVHQVAADLNDLRANVDRHVESQSASLRTEFEGLDDRIGQAERSQVSAVQQIAEHIQGQLAGRIEDLHQGLKLLSELSTRSHKEVAAELGDLGARFDKQAREQQASHVQTRERTAEATRAAKGEVAAILDQLRSHVEELARDQTAAVQKSSQDVQQAASAAQSELSASLDQLRSHVDQLAREQTSAVQKSSQDVQQAAGVAQSELSASLEQIGSRLEKALETRTRNLASDMMEVAEMVQSITTEVRSCIADSILRIVTANAETAAARSAAPEWPRIEVPNTEPAPTDGWPQSESIQISDGAQISPEPQANGESSSSEGDSVLPSEDPTP